MSAVLSTAAGALLLVGAALVVVEARLHDRFRAPGLRPWPVRGRR